MPFKINKLITAVDPVKLYEYIAFGKKTISIKYDEVLKFSNDVNLYQSYIEFSETLKKLLELDTYDNSSSKTKFIESNNWNCRKEEISIMLNDI